MRKNLLSTFAIVALGCGGQAAAGCKLARMLDLPVTMVAMHPMVTVGINGAEATFIADSGAFFSMMDPAGAAELKLKTYPAPWGMRITGIGGAASGVEATTVKDFRLGTALIHNVEFLVGGSDSGGGSVGVLGQNVFRLGDVEYDLSHGAIRIVHEDDCRKANLAYWATPEEPVSMIDIGATTPLQPHTTAVATVNGVKIRVMFDTGAYASTLSRKAAVRVGIKMDSPEVVEAGESRGVGRDTVKTWIARVADFKLGDEEIRNTQLRITDFDLGFADMLLGADFFLSHHVYVASKLGHLFFTYNGGRVFNLTTAVDQAPPPAAAGAAVDQAPPPVVAGRDAPGDAATASRRGSALAARRDFEHALADFKRACELVPDNPDYVYQRGTAYLGLEQPVAALADFDRALELKPDHVPALLARAQLRFREGRTAAATDDLDVIDRVVDPQADLRLEMAAAYLEAERLPQSLAQLTLWITAHRDDARLPEARSRRCWVRGLLGRDTADALDDCNAALKRIDKSSEGYAQVLVSRGLVRLRLGDYDKSKADFSAALERLPRNAWALYGRGIAELRRGSADEGHGDLDAATTLWAPVAERYTEHGIVP